MTAEQTTTRFLNGKLLANVTPREVIIRDRETLRERVRAGYIALRGGGVLLDMIGSPTGHIPGIEPPDEEGAPDDGMAALMYTAATLDHPHTGDGRPLDVKVTVAVGTSPKVLANLEAIGVEHPATQPILIDGTKQPHWADGYPRVGAEHVVHAFGAHFEPAVGQAPLSATVLAPAAV